MENLLQVLFVDYSHYYIPHKIINGEKVLILNKSHAEICEDDRLYDKAIKLTYNFNRKEWTVRTDGPQRTKLTFPELENFLNAKLAAFVLPASKEETEFKNIAIKITDYELPINKEKSNVKDVEIIKNLIKNSPNPSEEYINNARNFIQHRLNKDVFAYLYLAKNLSEESFYKMLDSVAVPLGKFVNSSEGGTLPLAMTDGKYFINIELIRK